MSWEGFEERLAKPLTHKLKFANGTVWLPEDDVTIDQWLISAAESDTELKELDIPAINFLQNWWPIERLFELQWFETFDKRTVLAMYTRRRAYILFGDSFEYHVVAAIEPKHETGLYRAVLEMLLENVHFVPKRPAIVKIRCPALVSHSESDTADDDRLQHVFGGENFAGLGGPVDWMHPGQQIRRAS